MRSDEQMAENLFGATAAPPTPAPQPKQPTEDEARAARIYGTVVDTPAPPRRPGQPETLDERAARHFYPELTKEQAPKPSTKPSAAKPSAKPSANVNAKTPVDPKAARLFPEKSDPNAKVTAEFIQRARKVSPHLPDNADHSFTEAIRESVKASDQQHKEWQRRVRLQMRADYGDEGPRLLKEANDIARRDPKLRKMMNDTGAGNHPAVINRFVQLALAERKKGAR